MFLKHWWQYIVAFTAGRNKNFESSGVVNASLIFKDANLITKVERTPQRSNEKLSY